MQCPDFLVSLPFKLYLEFDASPICRYIFDTLLHLPENPTPPFRSPTKPTITRQKVSPRKWSASAEYMALAERAAEAELPLPYKYKFLLEVFRNVETVVSMKFNRHEQVRKGTLNKLTYFNVSQHGWEKMELC